MAELERFLTPIPLAADEDYSRVPAPEECGEELIDITERSPRIHYGAAYLCQGLEGALDRCWVRRGVWERLERAVALLPEEYSLLIFDGLRPLTVQRAIYNQFADMVRAERPDILPAQLELLLDDFVAKPVKRPARPAPHSTGGAVDLTLCRWGEPLDMGTGFDDLTAMAHTDWFERSSAAEGGGPGRDRRLLYNVMCAAGFASYACEWWHYAYGERMWAREQGCAPIYGFCPECDFPK